jgi:hypothetical protein
VLIELNPEYAKLATDRCGLFCEKEVESCRLLPVAAVAADEGEDEDEEEGR